MRYDHRRGVRDCYRCGEFPESYREGAMYRLRCGCGFDVGGKTPDLAATNWGAVHGFANLLGDVNKRLSKLLASHTGEGDQGRNQ